jgi:hypothetical protein
VSVRALAVLYILLYSDQKTKQRHSDAPFLKIFETYRRLGEGCNRTGMHKHQKLVTGHWPVPKSKEDIESKPSADF